MAKPTWMVGAIVSLIGLALVYAHPVSAAEPDDEKSGAATDEPICRVRTAVIRQAALSLDLAASGVIASAPEALRSITLTYDCRISRVLAHVGQTVAAGTMLCEVEPSVEAKAQRAEALAAHDAALVEANQVQQRSDMHLATIQELTQAQQAVTAAAVRVASWAERIPANGSIIAPTAAIVTKLDVHAGQIIVAGTELAELTEAGHAVARLGIDPSDLHILVVGQSVSLVSLRRQRDASAVITAQIAGWSTVVDPETRLVTALASVPADADLLRGEAVQAHIALSLPESLIVPRAALVADGTGGWQIFVIVDGKASKRAVTILGESRTESAITGDGITLDLPVVIEGGPELEDGMAVETATPP